MASVEEIVTQSVANMTAHPGVSARPDVTPERIKDLIDRLIANLENVDPDEAAEITAKIEAAVAAFSSGNWLVGMLALAAAFSLYRKAIKD